jgi:hypothetical protein
MKYRHVVKSDDVQGVVMSNQVKRCSLDGLMFYGSTGCGTIFASQSSCEATIWVVQVNPLQVLPADLKAARLVTT